MREYGYERSMEIFSPEEMREVLKNPGYLPTREEISYAFTGSKDTIDNETNKTIEDDLDEEPFDQEKLDKELEEESKFVEFCFDRDNPTFEFLNEEYLNDLSNYISERVKLLALSDEPITIMEAGAGNGRLTHFLKQKLEERIPGKFRIIATDSGEWKIETAFPVDKIRHEEALKKYQPQIVLFSWMPYKEDYTTEFRSTGSVEEYILIGETDGGCCGDEYETWHNRFETTTEQSPYKKDIFYRNNLEAVSKNQFCRTDSPGRFQGHSETVSFRRQHTLRKETSKYLHPRERRRPPGSRRPDNQPQAW